MDSSWQGTDARCPNPWKRHDPENIIDKNGADILRIWVASSDYRGDVRISQEIFENLIESYRRIRNTARFLLANLKGFDPEKDSMPNDKLSQIDQYILIKLRSFVQDARTVLMTMNSISR